MAKNTTTATTTDGEYQSPEMADILERIEEQNKSIEAAREELKKLRNEKRRQARADAKEAERLAREREQREGVELLRALRSSTVRMSDGTTVNALEYVTNLVSLQGVSVESQGSSDGGITTASDED